MDWEEGRRSDNVEDRRGVGRPVAIGTGVTLLALLLGWVFGVDPSQLLALLSQTDSAPGSTSTSTAPVKGSPQEERQKDFVSVVLASTEDTWTPLFAARGLRYVPPSWCFSAGRSNRPAASPKVHPAPSTARPTTASFWTCPSSMS